MRVWGIYDRTTIFKRTVVLLGAFYFSSVAMYFSIKSCIMLLS